MASVVIIRPAIDAASLQRDAHDLRRIDDARVQHVDILPGLRVEAVGLGLVLVNLADHHRAAAIKPGECVGAGREAIQDVLFVAQLALPHPVRQRRHRG